MGSIVFVLTMGGAILSASATRPCSPCMHHEQCGGRIPIPFGTGSAARVVAEREPVTSSGLASVSSLTTVRWGSPDLHGLEVGREGSTALSAGADAFGMRVGSIDS